MTVSEAPDSERAIRHTRLEPSSSLPHPKLPPRSQHADNRTQCEVYRERDPETDSDDYGFELGSRRLLISTVLRNTCTVCSLEQITVSPYRNFANLLITSRLPHLLY